MNVILDFISTKIVIPVRIAILPIAYCVPIQRSASNARPDTTRIMEVASQLDSATASFTSEEQRMQQAVRSARQATLSSIVLVISVLDANCARYNSCVKVSASKMLRRLILLVWCRSRYGREFPKDWDGW